MPRPEDEYTDEPPRRRRRRDDEDEDYDEDRPRRRSVRKRELSGMDGMFANTNTVVLVLFGIFCGLIALILGIIGLATCKDEVAKRNAMIVTIISGVMTVVGVIVRIALVAARV